MKLSLCRISLVLGTDSEKLKQQNNSEQMIFVIKQNWGLGRILRHREQQATQKQSIQTELQVIHSSLSLRVYSFLHFF